MQNRALLEHLPRRSCGLRTPSSCAGKSTRTHSRTPGRALSCQHPIEMDSSRAPSSWAAAICRFLPLPWRRFPLRPGGIGCRRASGRSQMNGIRLQRQGLGHGQILRMVLISLRNLTHEL